ALMCCAGVAVAALGLLGLRSVSRSRITAVVAPGAPAVAGADWSLFRGNLNRTGAAPSASGPTKGAVAWYYRDPQARVADLSSSPAVVGNRVYIGSAQASVFDSTGMVYCIDA